MYPCLFLKKPVQNSLPLHIKAISSNLDESKCIHAELNIFSMRKDPVIVNCSNWDL